MKRFVALLAVVAATLFVAAPAQAVTNGQPDAGRHPYVGLAVFDTTVDGVTGPAWRCSGTLLSPTVFLVAGHCTDGAVAARVWLSENVQSNTEYPFSGRPRTTASPYTYPTTATRPAGPACPSSPTSTSA